MIHGPGFSRQVFYAVIIFNSQKVLFLGLLEIPAKFIKITHGFIHLSRFFQLIFTFVSSDSLTIIIDGLIKLVIKKIF